MIRTQVYLTAAERKKLSLLVKELGSSQSELIRQAIDQYIMAKSALGSHRLAMLQAAKGMWSHRDDLPNLASLRDEFEDRSKT